MPPPSQAPHWMLLTGRPCTIQDNYSETLIMDRLVVKATCLTANLKLHCMLQVLCVHDSADLLAVIIKNYLKSAGGFPAEIRSLQRISSMASPFPCRILH